MSSLQAAPSRKKKEKKAKAPTPKSSDGDSWSFWGLKERKPKTKEELAKWKYDVEQKYDDIFSSDEEEWDDIQFMEEYNRGLKERYINYLKQTPRSKEEAIMETFGEFKDTPYFADAMELIADIDDPNYMAEYPKEVFRAGDAANYRSGAIVPQWFLAGSTHPYAPFIGNAPYWESFVFDDGTTYEGLAVFDIPHVKGTINFACHGPGGINDAGRGDKYEGEFYHGWAMGMGQMNFSQKAKVYQGEFHEGFKHGCGVMWDLKPYRKLIKKGLSPLEAWNKSKKEIHDKAQRGTWHRDKFVAGPDASGSKYCHESEIRGVVQEVNEVVHKARMFQFKPDGDATTYFAQDANGLPAPLMQDPMHYPHGTAFLAPGPAGQCHPVPENEELKTAMRRSARQHARIWMSYNLPHGEPEPGSEMERGKEIWFHRKLARIRALRRHHKYNKVFGGPPPNLRPEEDTPTQPPSRRDRGRAPPQPPSSRRDSGPSPSPPSAPTDYDEEDLVASLPEPNDSKTVLASVTVGLQQALHQMRSNFDRMAVPSRRSLTRPRKISQ